VPSAHNPRKRIIVFLECCPANRYDRRTRFPEKVFVGKFASEWLFIAHSDAELQTIHAASPAQNRQLPVGSSGVHPG
jgi:hypothetical protein